MFGQSCKHVCFLEKRERHFGTEEARCKSTPLLNVYDREREEFFSLLLLVQTSKMVRFFRSRENFVPAEKSNYCTFMRYNLDAFAIWTHEALFELTQNYFSIVEQYFSLTILQSKSRISANKVQNCTLATWEGENALSTGRNEMDGMQSSSRWEVESGWGYVPKMTRERTGCTSACRQANEWDESKEWIQRRACSIPSKSRV